MSNTTITDNSFRFLFEDADVRGETVTLHHVLNDLCAAHPYGDGVKRLLGEFAAAAVVISITLNLKGELCFKGAATCRSHLSWLNALQRAKSEGWRRVN